MRALVIIPTYNESENIKQLVPEILKLAPESHILVVDDNSPDGTAKIVESFSKNDERVHLLLRKQKNGLGRAYVAGFQWGLEKGYDYLVEMDADFSHRPVDLVKILKAAGEADFIVGSRYVPGGAVVNWALSRRMLSRGGSLYSRVILGFPINDWTGGFNAWHARVLKGIGIENIESNGYSFQIELKYRAQLKKFKCKEVPITFEERREGQSKMSSRIVVEALFRVWKLRFS